MPAFNSRATGDQYGTDPTTQAIIQNAYNPRGGWFSINNGPGVICQLQYQQDNRAGNRGRGSEAWAFDETQLGGGATGTIPANAIGIRFRNAVAGSNAIVTAFIGTGDDPVLEIDSFGADISNSTATLLAFGQTTGTHGTATSIHAASLTCLAAVVKGNPSNVGIVYVGDGTVTTSTGYELAADDAIAFAVNNASTVHFDVDTTGDTVSWMIVG